MDIKFTPGKLSDKGGYFCMPLRVNIPNGKKGWKLMCCPECGAQCWKSPVAEIVEKQGAKGFCTMCALKKGIR